MLLEQVAPFVGEEPEEPMAGEGGFEPPITRPKPVALPLGHSPIKLINFISNLHKIQTLVIRFKAIIDLGIIYLNNSKLNE